ncbi:hypothetical protein BO71DRAFT_80342 [Aspergillus ellipticus CBS 707.79]|uniref:Uncharacterized protein n=1 Tax=Aspergillus ellipticus CBS 707.79 TaxID=1448320 RepID=A0A319D006_9EURO|nr:hypothetical protein BO71DRAFT_80342 [Aspergillus ellipticus CBS 707.79]
MHCMEYPRVELHFLAGLLITHYWLLVNIPLIHLVNVSTVRAQLNSVPESVSDCLLRLRCVPLPYLLR